MKKPYKVLFMLFYIFIILGPLLSFIPYAFNNPLPEFVTLFSQRELFLLLKTVVLSLCVSIACMTTGIFSGLYIYTAFSKKNTMRVLMILIIFAFVPPYVYASAWNGFISWANLFLFSFSAKQIILKGFWGSLLVFFASYLPLCTVISILGFKLTGRKFVDMAKVYANDIKVFFKVVLPLAFRIITAGAAVVFVLCIGDYGIPSLYQFSVYSLDIFARFSIDGNPIISFIRTLPLLLFILPAVIIIVSGIRKTFIETSFKQDESPLNYKWPVWFKSINLLSFIILSGLLLILVFGLLIVLKSPLNIIEGFKKSHEEIGASFLISFFTALLGTIICLWLVSYAYFNNIKSKLFWCMAVLPSIIPASLTGIGIILLYNNTYFDELYQTIAMPIVASVSRFSLFSIIILLSFYKLINPAYFECCEIYQKSFLKKLFKINLPLIAPGLIVSFCLYFSLSLGELGASLLVLPPGVSTMTVKIYNYMHYGESSQIMALCVIMLLFILLMGTICFLLSGKLKKWYDINENTE